MILPALYIGPSARKGRGVFTSENLGKGLLIEASPVIVMSQRERTLLDQTLLHDYIFLWGADRQQCCVALGYLSLYNHDYQANCDYNMDFSEALIRISTLREIRHGEELCINYNGHWNDPRPVWFDPLSFH